MNLVIKDYTSELEAEKLRQEEERLRLIERSKVLEQVEEEIKKPNIRILGYFSDSYEFPEEHRKSMDVSTGWLVSKHPESDMKYECDNSFYYQYFFPSEKTEVNEEKGKTSFIVDVYHKFRDWLDNGDWER